MIIKNKARYWPFFIFLLFADFDSFSQEIKLLEGQIITDSISPENVHIVNLDLENGTTSSNSGIFSIYAKAGNRILFSSVQFEKREIIISKTDLDSGKIQVKLLPARNELEEVNISDLKLSGHLETDLPKISYFDREKYGIPYPKKKLSQTERRLYTANEGITSRWQYIGVLLGGVSLDVVLNDINGRTKYLKNLDKQDKLQVLVQHGIDVLGRSFFISDLGLPESEIENFVFYCADDVRYKKLVLAESTLKLVEFFSEKVDSFKELRELD